MWNGLHVAAEAGVTEICRYLVEKSLVDPNVLTFQGSNCAVIACNTTLSCLKFFHEELGQSLDGFNRFGENGAFAAVRTQSLPLLKYLFEHGVDMFSRNKED
jgi:hypothetical protein